MDPATIGTQTAKALAEAQNVQQILAIVAGVLVAALFALALLYWKESREHRAELKKEQDDRRLEVRELYDLMTSRLSDLAKALDAEHDRTRAVGGLVGDEPDQASKSGARRRV